MIVNPISHSSNTLRFFVNDIRVHVNSNVIHTTGSHPFTDEELKLLIHLGGGVTEFENESLDWQEVLDLYDFGKDEFESGSIAARADALIDICRTYISERIDFIVIGEKEFDESFLQFSLEFQLEKWRYITQQEFAHFALSGEIFEYNIDHPRWTEHPGLSYLSSIGFIWPTTNISSTLKYQMAVHERAEQSPLRMYTGYTVEKGTSISERRMALRKGVRILGLEQVAFHIAGQIKEKQRRRDDHMENAITNWYQDLAWLKVRYYDGKRHSFTWPHIR